MPAPSNRDLALERAIALAVEKLAGVDFAVRCPALGLAAPDAQGVIRLRVLGQDMGCGTHGFTLAQPDGAPVAPTLHGLVLHYLLCEEPLSRDGEPVSYRAFPGGQFYLGPFRQRTVEPLARLAGNDVEKLKDALHGLDWEPAAPGDFAARVHVIGHIHCTLVHHVGDDEFPANADLLFSPAALHACGADDAAMWGTLLCGRIMRALRAPTP
ncbi:MAG: DUF3786 domain-containing protein [Desulfovibrionaceae bacterium]